MTRSGPSSVRVKSPAEVGLWRVYGDALAVALSAHLLGKYAAHVPNTLGHSAGLPACKLRRVVEYINDNLTEDLRLAELADVAAMNPHHFSRAFKQATGVTPKAYRGGT